MSFSLWEGRPRSASPTKPEEKGRMRAKIDAFPNPHPALRATLSRRERDTPLHDGHAKIHATQAFEPTTRLSFGQQWEGAPALRASLPKERGHPHILWVSCTPLCQDISDPNA